MKNIGLMSLSALAILALPLGSAHACHRYADWRYPWPQHCGSYAASPSKSYYVEIVTPLAVKPVASAPLEYDARTPEQIKEIDEHMDAVAKHHDEINRLMVILHAEEDAAKAAELRP